jgi:hypothetical protein
MFGQIKMEIPWYINRHTLISRKRDGKPRMIIGGHLATKEATPQISGWFKKVLKRVGYPHTEVGGPAGGAVCEC